ncbi:MAG: CPBP family intramembrane metalloprotease [Gemmatimonadetes bacterium]|nr:CPBP family intramembrane metalloprotease [Gemmatimonadota bacterium]
MTAVDAVTVAALLMVLPGFAVAQARALQGVVIPRLPAYASSAATLVLVAAWCTVVGVWARGPSTLGFVGMAPGPAAGWTLAVVLAGLGLMLGFRTLGNALGAKESETLHQLLPRTPGERLGFACLSVIAGLSEEIVFRGYALSALAGVTGVATAAVLTSVAFGVLHAYQGILGVIRTAALGGLLAWGFVAAGSIWPVVAAHAVLDLLGGLVLAERLMGSDPVRPRDTKNPGGVR